MAKQDRLTREYEAKLRAIEKAASALAVIAPKAACDTPSRAAVRVLQQTLARVRQDWQTDYQTRREHQALACPW